MSRTMLGRLKWTSFWNGPKELTALLMLNTALIAAQPLTAELLVTDSPALGTALAAWRSI